MTLDSLSMIRRGWQEGATSADPQVPGLADLLDRRLEEAIRKGTLDEATLLAIVDSATQLAADCGSAEVVPGLSKRLRRRVYEYLLSLDAAPPAERQDPSTPRLAAPDWSGMWPDAEKATQRPSPVHAPAAGPLVGADEAVDLGRRQLPQFSPIPLEPRPDANRQAPRTAPPSPTAAPGHGERPSPAPANLPHFRFHIGDPEDLPTDASPDEQAGARGDPAALDPFPAGDIETPPFADVSTPRRASFADPSTWPKPVTPTLKPARGPEAKPDLPPETGPPPAVHAVSPPPGEGRLSLSWPSPLDPRREDPSQNGGWPASRAPEYGHETRSIGEVSHEPAEEAAPEAPVPASANGNQSQSGWAVRQPDTVQIHLRPLAGGPFESDEDVLAPFTVDEIPESDLRQLRAAIDLKLRKKKCDDAAAMLQQAAHELGGQAVAEMALDIGDRCRALGKGNAALNCYLAASRADPIFEPPLARLADICIDDHDIDLAVSYLERIARLTRLRGDNRGALRIYRKIATIAPYRDDVLEMLMRAQTTGRLEP